MNESTTSGLLHAVDRLVISGRRIFGWGWAAHDCIAVSAVRLRVESASWQRRLVGNFGLSREDVEQEHPDLVNAGTSGFVLTGFVPEGAVLKMHLEIVYEDGTEEEFDVTPALDDRHDGRSRRRLISWILRASWRRLRRGDIVGIVRRARAQHYAAPSVENVDALGDLVRVLAKCADVCLLFDNNMGGGSNHYRRALIAEKVASGQTVLLCTYNLPVLEYRLHLFRPGKSEQVFRLSTFLLLDRVLGEAPVTEIFVNSPVSFDEPLLLAEWLARMRAERPGLRLTLTAHDYFAVCPSFVLLNAESKFCGIPEDISVCASCLKRHQASYVALSPPSEIGPWRALWGRCLQAADEVRCFSQATRTLLLRAYPGLDPARLTLVPHRVDFVPARMPKIDPHAPLVIGIVGEISMQKGARLVEELVARIERDRPEVRVVVLGTLDVARRSERLRVTGAYKRADLVDLIESHGINMFLFPSIWPETFSYVVAELTQLGVPIVAFDLGAPAERLRHYPQARLCSEISASAALDTLVRFHRELAMDDAAAA